MKNWSLLFLDVSKDKQPLWKENVDSEKQKERQLSKSVTQKMYKDFLRNNQNIPNKRNPKTNVFPHKSNNRDQSQSIYRIHSSRRNSSPLTNKTVEIQSRGQMLTLDHPLRTVTTMTTVPVIIQIDQDQLRLIGILQIVDLPLHTKETNR